MNHMKYLKTIDNVRVRTLDIGTLGVVTRRQTGVCPVQRRVERRGGGRAVIRHRSVSGWRCRCRGSVKAVPGESRGKPLMAIKEAAVLRWWRWVAARKLS